MPIGSKVELGLLRDGKPVTVTVELQQSNQTQVDSSTCLLYTSRDGAGSGRTDGTAWRQHWAHGAGRFPHAQSGSCLLYTSHSEEDIDNTIDAARRVFAKL